METLKTPEKRLINWKISGERFILINLKNDNRKS